MSGALRRRSFGPALRRTAAQGFAHLDDVVEPALLRALWRELRAGPLRPMEGSFGRVRMQIAGFDVADPMDAFPRIAELRDAVTERVRREGANIRGLATWRPNEAGIGMTRPGQTGITSHLDGRWYRRLVAVVTVAGSARFEVTATREGPVVEGWRAGPGGMTLMRGPGLAGRRDGRPFHRIGPPSRGVRCSVALRMSVDPPTA
jgi:hypothetical protein